MRRDVKVMMAGLCDPMFLAQLTSIPIRHTLVKNDLYIGHTLDTLDTYHPTNYTSQNTMRISILSIQYLRLRNTRGLLDDVSKNGPGCQRFFGSRV